MAATLYCDRCGRKAKYVGEELQECGRCKTKTFTTRPEWARMLNHNDRRFLRSLRIATSEGE